MADRMTHDDLKSEQESQRGGFNDQYADYTEDTLSRHDSHTSIGGVSTKGKCLHCQAPGHQWRACQWRCSHCGTYEHSHVPRIRASTQCPALLRKKPRFYDQHSYRHTTDRGNAVARGHGKSLGLVELPFAYGT